MKNKSQSGNVMIIILVTVALFGALFFTFGRTSQQGSGNLTKQQSRLAAQEIVTYALLMEEAVSRLITKGCSENFINFNDSQNTGYANTSAPGDGSCDVFSTNGGKISYQPPQDIWLDSTHSAQSFYGEYIITTTVCVQQLPADTNPNCALDTSPKNDDLILFVPYLKEEICLEINKLIGRTEIPEDNGNLWGASPKYTGSFPSTNGQIGSVNTGAALRSVPSMCLKQEGAPYYHYYRVLMAR